MHIHINVESEFVQDASILYIYKCFIYLWFLDDIHFCNAHVTILCSHYLDACFICCSPHLRTTSKKKISAQKCFHMSEVHYRIIFAKIFHLDLTLKVLITIKFWRTQSTYECSNLVYICDACTVYSWKLLCFKCIFTLNIELVGKDFYFYFYTVFSVHGH